MDRQPRNALDMLFLIARGNPKAPMNQPGRGMGKHASQRFEAARAKAHKRAKRGPYHSRYFPGTKRPAVPYVRLSSKEQPDAVH